MNDGRNNQLHSRGRLKQPRQAQLCVIAHVAVVASVAPHGLVVEVSFFLDEVPSTPEQHMASPRGSFEGRACEKCLPRSREFGSLTVGRESRQQSQQLEIAGKLTTRPSNRHSASTGEAVGNRANRELLSAVMDDVELQGNRERTRGT